MAKEAIEVTLAFVDLAGFTALTETHGDEAAADLAAEFQQLARAALGPDDRLVKSIGDAVMLVSPEPESALGLVQRLLSGCLDAPDFPIVRTGLHHGQVVTRGDDVFGAAVNLAARVAAHAAGGQVLGTDWVADVARAIGLDTTALGRHRFRNIGDPVAVFEIHLQAAEEDREVDPVCRMSVTRGGAAGRLRYAGREWWFCSLDCTARFSAAPDRYLPAS